MPSPFWKSRFVFLLSSPSCYFSLWGIPIILLLLYPRQQKILAVMWLITKYEDCGQNKRWGKENISSRNFRKCRKTDEYISWKVLTTKNTKKMYEESPGKRNLRQFRIVMNWVCRRNNNTKFESSLLNILSTRSYSQSVLGMRPSPTWSVTETFFDCDMRGLPETAWDGCLYTHWRDIVVLTLAISLVDVRSRTSAFDGRE